MINITNFMHAKFCHDACTIHVFTINGAQILSSTKTHTLISGVLHNPVSDGSWGHKNTAFGICPVKVGKSSKKERNRKGQANKIDRGRETNAKRMKESPFVFTDAHGLGQSGPRGKLLHLNFGCCPVIFKFSQLFVTSKVTKDFPRPCTVDLRLWNKTWFYFTHHSNILLSLKQVHIQT